MTHSQKNLRATQLIHYLNSLSENAYHEFRRADRQLSQLIERGIASKRIRSAAYEAQICAFMRVHNIR